MTRMDLELLEVLVAFAEAENLVHAAGKLKISQPAVTQRLQRLQEQSPLPLYSFAGRKKILTAYGKGLYRLSKDIFLQLEKGLETLNRSHADGSQLVLRLGCRKELVEIFAQTVSFAGRIQYNQMTERQALSSLQDDQIDVALVTKHSYSADLVSKKIFEGSSHFVFSKKIFPEVHSFRDLQKNKNSLNGAPFIAHSTEKEDFARFCKGFEVEIANSACKATVEDWSLFAPLVEQGLGYAVVPAFVRTNSKAVTSFEIPHSVLPRAVYYAVFHRRLKKIDAFQRALSFTIHSS